MNIPDAAVEAAAHAMFEVTGEPDWTAMEIRQVVEAAAPYIAAQALRDAAKQIECQHVGSCLGVGNDYCYAPEDGSMVRSAMIARANRIEADHG